MCAQNTKAAQSSTEDAPYSTLDDRKECYVLSGISLYRYGRNDISACDVEAAYHRIKEWGIRPSFPSSYSNQCAPGSLPPYIEDKAGCGRFLETYQLWLVIEGSHFKLFKVSLDGKEVLTEGEINLRRNYKHGDQPPSFYGEDGDDWEYSFHPNNSKPFAKLPFREVEQLEMS